MVCLCSMGELCTCRCKLDATRQGFEWFCLFRLVQLTARMTAVFVFLLQGSEFVRVQAQSQAFTNRNKPLPSFLITERHAYLEVSKPHLDLASSNLFLRKNCLLPCDQCLVLCSLSWFHRFAFEPNIFIEPRDEWR